MAFIYYAHPVLHPSGRAFARSKCSCTLVRLLADFNGYQVDPLRSMLPCMRYPACREIPYILYIIATGIHASREIPHILYITAIGIHASRGIPHIPVHKKGREFPALMVTTLCYF